MISFNKRKTIAVFFLINFLLSAFAPGISLALTSGPTAPEFTSFEPVDTSEMVNLPTGDFVYNLPLLEVPGPSGGYPLSLSYHAGLMPNEEASWVGYGFTLNPGSITRTVNGYPDDHLAASRTREDFNDGARINTFTVGIGYPGVSYGLAVSHDTNRGIGIGSSIGIGGAVGPFQIGASYGVSPFGGTTGSLGVGFGNLGISVDNHGEVNGNIGITANVAKNLSTDVGISTNFNGQVGFSADLRAVGADMSTEGVRAVKTVAGFSISQVNSKANDWNTKSFGFSVPIPLGYSGVFLNLGYNYFRYYLHQSSLVNVIGSLHANKTSIANPDNWAFDSYALINTDSEKALKDQQPDKSNGGSFPSYDMYQVNAQGLNGSIQPYIINNGTLFRQNLKDGSRYDIKFEKVNNFSSPVHFRFKNDFSNAYYYSKNEMQVRPQNTSFLNSLETPKAEGFNSKIQKLAGSKNIEWYTNLQISNGEARQAGFVDFQSSGLRKLIFNEQNIADQIGGYSITNESGVTYHYALPAYVFDEFSKSFVKDKPTKIYQNNFNQTPYAYMWLLTAVTGPDYVDRNGNGMVDETDWGYWVSFEYGKWADDFKWRNPVNDFHSDLDDNYKFYSRGKKQVYYLDAIKTKTHVAVFEKAVRKDSKGLVDFDLAPSFVPKVESGKTIKPTESLSLKNVYLLTTRDYNALGGDQIRSSAGQNFTCSESPNTGKTFPCKVFDEGDDSKTLAAKAIRVISLEHSNRLQPGTVNSFNVSTPSILDGKLTLDAVRFKGKAGSDFLPPLKFEYGNNNPSYAQENYDMWGFYKSDYTKTGFNNLDRLVSDASALSVDAWSLRKIVTSLGAAIEIEYESDKYLQPPLSNTYQFSVSGLTRIDNQQVKIGLFKKQSNISALIKEGVQINMIGMSSESYSIHESTTDPDCAGVNLFQPSPQRDFNIFDKNLTITRVEDGGDQIFVYVNDPSLAEQFRKKDTQILPLGRQVFRYQCNEKNANGTPVIVDGPTSCVRIVTNPDGSTKQENYAGTPVTCDIQQQLVFTQPVIHAGNVGVLGVNDNTLEYKGGGLRVKQIAVTNDPQNKRVTKYQYADGVSSYEPSGLNLADYLNETTIPEEQKADYAYRINKRFSNLLQIAREVPAPGVIYKYVSISEEVVTKGITVPVPGKRVHEFEVFDEKFVERIGMKKLREETENLPPQECFDSNGQIIPCDPRPCHDEHGDPIPCPPPTQTFATYSPLTINDYSVWIASPKKVSTYGPNDQLYEQVTNHYLHDNKTTAEYQALLKSSFGNQGVISQIFNEQRVSEHNFGKTIYHVFSKKAEYPLVTVGVTQKNFKTGITIESENLSFDFYSGTPLKTISTDSYGNRFMTESIPAYKIAEFSGMTSQQIESKMRGMGLMVNNPGNRNMLTQVASTVVYKVDNTNTPVGLVSAGIQTWTDQTPVNNASPQRGIWRTDKTFSWSGKESLNPDGTYKYDHFAASAFQWNNAVPTSNWKLKSDVTLYDASSHTLEASNFYDNKVSTRFDPYEVRVIASALNAGYNDIAFSGAEYLSGNTDNEGGVLRGAGTASIAHAHSGKYSLLVPSNSTGFQYTLETRKADLSRKYRASVWVYVPGDGETQAELEKVQLSCKINGVEKEVHPTLQKTKSKSWYLLDLDFNPGDNAVEISVRNNSVRGVYFDDFRVHPLDATMTSYVYDQSTGELTFILDAKNFYTKYEYDQMGRLTRTSRELLNFDFGPGKESYRADRVLNEMKYNYGKQ